MSEELTKGKDTVLKLVIFASGAGTTMQAVIDAIECGKLNAEIGLVISNNKGAGALERAAKAGIGTYVIRAKKNDPGAIDAELMEVLEEYNPDLILLLGYLWKIGDGLIARYPMRIVNTHPALLPEKDGPGEFGGPGMHGEKVYEKVLAAGVKETGATLHYVMSEQEYDAGPVIKQVKVPVGLGDDAQTLAAKVQEKEKVQLVDWLIGQAKAKEAT